MSNSEDENILNICKTCIKEWSDYLDRNPHDDFRFGMPDRFKLAELLLSELMKVDNGNVSEESKQSKAGTSN